MSDVLHIESPECQSEMTEGDCTAESASVATDGDSYLGAESNEVNDSVIRCRRLPDKLAATDCYCGLVWQLCTNYL